jgi:Zn-finger nucleic acid-binding protein
MHRESSDGAELAVCEGCGGVWLNDGRLADLRAQPVFVQEQLLERLRERPNRGLGQMEPVLTCPRCLVPMMPEDVGLIAREPVLTCPKCFGSFLAEGRLEELLEVVAAGRAAEGGRGAPRRRPRPAR